MTGRYDTLMDAKRPKRKRKRRVKEPLTDELLAELLSAPDPEVFADAHKLTTRNLSDYLQQLLAEKGLAQSKVISAAGVQYTYGYELFTGKKRNPDRNILLQILFAMGCTLKEANRALQAAGKNGLYCKDRRDAIIIFCLDHGYTLQEVDQALFDYGEQTISGEA